VKVGDLVKLIRYGSRFAADGSIGLIIEELPFDPGTDAFCHRHRAYHVRCTNGYIALVTEYCLEVISEGASHSALKKRGKNS
jgi:hypothetical protein